MRQKKLKQIDATSSNRQALDATRQSLLPWVDVGRHCTSKRNLQIRHKGLLHKRVSLNSPVCVRSLLTLLYPRCVSKKPCRASAAGSTRTSEGKRAVVGSPSRSPRSYFRANQPQLGRATSTPRPVALLVNRQSGRQSFAGRQAGGRTGGLADRLATSQFLSSASPWEGDSNGAGRSSGPPARTGPLRSAALRSPAPRGVPASLRGAAAVANFLASAQTRACAFAPLGKAEPWYLPSSLPLYLQVGR